MDFRVFVEPQQEDFVSRPAQCARASEELGYDGFFRSDHYLPVGNESGLPGPTDSWITLAGLALETRWIRAGDPRLVSRAPPAGPAGGPGRPGRRHVGWAHRGPGLRAGWYAEEHAAYGIPFPRQAVRQARRQDPGRQRDLGRTHRHHLRLRRRALPLSGCPGLPKPRQERLPIIVGGRGPVRTPLLAARHADEYNIGFVRPEVAAAQFARVRDACVAEGRDPSTPTCSAALVVCCGESDHEVARRAERMGPGVAKLGDRSVWFTRRRGGRDREVSRGRGPARLPAVSRYRRPRSHRTRRTQGTASDRGDPTRTTARNLTGRDAPQRILRTRLRFRGSHSLIMVYVT